MYAAVAIHFLQSNGDLLLFCLCWNPSEVLCTPVPMYLYFSDIFFYYSSMESSDELLFHVNMSQFSVLLISCKLFSVILLCRCFVR